VIGEKMKVNFFAGLRQIVGQKTVEIPISEGATASQLVAEIVRCYPALERELLDEHGNLYGHVHVVINGRDIRHLEGGMERVITYADKVSLFPAIGGG
jgi:molybdopterin synthase sulfur carrier subunit